MLKQSLSECSNLSLWSSQSLKYGPPGDCLILGVFAVKSGDQLVFMFSNKHLWKVICGQYNYTCMVDL